MKQATTTIQGSRYNMRTRTVSDNTPATTGVQVDEIERCSECGGLPSENVETCPSIDHEGYAAPVGPSVKAPTTGVHTATPCEHLNKTIGSVRGVPYFHCPDCGNTLDWLPQPLNDTERRIATLEAALRAFVDAETNENYGYATKADAIMRAVIAARTALRTAEGGE